MPDPNKLKVLKEAGYIVRPSCDSCEHFIIGTNKWGTCGVIKYQHSKHTGDPRNASVRRDGWCPKYNCVSSTDLEISGFEIFLQL